MGKTSIMFLVILVLLAITISGQGQTSQSTASTTTTTTTTIDQLYWNFDKGFEGWERTGSVPPWHTMESAIQWYDQWGGAQGVVVIDACECRLCGDEGIHAKGVIKKTVTLPQNVKTITFNVVRVNHDGGVRFAILDSEGQHVLGEEILSGEITKQLSYDVSAWRGKAVTLEVQTFGAGIDATGCACPDPRYECGLCCGEYVGIDWVKCSSSKLSIPPTGINAEDLDKYNQIKQQVIGPNYKGPIQIQRIAILQVIGGLAAVDTVQVDSEGKIVRAWTQTGYLGGLAAKAEIGYAIRKSDKPPTAGLEVFIEPEANVGPVKAEGGLKVDIDEHGISGGEISGGVEAGPVAVTGSTSTEGWIGVGNFGVGASILGDMRTEEPKEIDHNSIFDKIIFDIIYATYGPTQPIDPAKMVGTRSDLTQTPIP